jgi:hypothetical protein
MRNALRSSDPKMRGFLSLLFFCLVLSMSRAQLPDRVADRPPTQGPTQVKTGLYYIDISDIDGATETFSATAYLVLEWNDPRLKFETTDPSKVRLYKLNPRISGRPRWRSSMPTSSITKSRRCAL